MLNDIKKKFSLGIKDPKKTLRYFAYRPIFMQYEWKRKILLLNNYDKDTVILASYPKSGNTLFRFIWMNIINLVELGCDKIDFVKLEENLPTDLFYCDLNKKWEFDTLPVLLKTHDKYSDKFMNFKSVYVYRHPVDTMISNYYYFSSRIGGPNPDNLSIIEKKVLNYKKPFKGTFHEFIKFNFESYCQHVSSWIRSGSLLCSYEKLVSNDGPRYYQRILNRLDKEIDLGLIQEAFALSDKKNLKNSPPSPKMAKLKGMKFIRDGSLNQWKDLASENDLVFIKRKMKDYKLLDFFVHNYGGIFY